MHLLHSQSTQNLGRKRRRVTRLTSCKGRLANTEKPIDDSDSIEGCFYRWSNLGNINWPNVSSIELANGRPRQQNSPNGKRFGGCSVTCWNPIAQDRPTAFLHPRKVPGFEHGDR